MAVDLNAIAEQIKKIQAGIPALTQQVQSAIPKPVTNQPNLGNISSQISNIQSQIPNITAGVNSLKLPQTGMTQTDTTQTGTTGGTDSSSIFQSIKDALSNITKQQSDYQTMIANQPSAMDLYNQAQSATGLSGKQAAYDATLKQINDLEANVAARSSGTFTTAAQLARETAVEQRPLAKQLEAESVGLTGAQSQMQQLLTALQGEQTTKSQAALTGIQGEEALLPTLLSMAEYQSPQQQLASKIAEEKQLKSMGLGSYYTPKITTVPAGSAAVGPTGELLYKNPSAASAGVDPLTLAGMLSVWQSGGGTPSFGYGATGSATRNAFYQSIGQAQTAGTDVVGEAMSNKASLAGATTALKTQQNQLSANQTALSTLDKQLKIVQSYSNKVDRSGRPVLNKYLLWTKNQFAGDEDTAALNNAIQTASYEFSKILSGAAASIAGVTISSADDAKNVLNANMTPSQINEVVSLMMTEGKNRLTSQQSTIDQIKQDIKDLSAGGMTTGSSGDIDPLGVLH